MRRWIIAMSVVAVAVGSAALPASAKTSTAALQTDAAAAVAGATTYLPFDLPSTASLRSSPKKVFAHYVPWYPISFDNKLGSVDYYAKNYLDPNGEGGKYLPYGGKQRDRPMERAPILNDLDWQIRDMETEVRQAITAGIDGFVVSLVSFGDTQTANAVVDLLKAAQNVDSGFKIMLRPNRLSPSIMSMSAADFAKNMAALGAYSSAYRLADNRLVISPFKAESDTVAWWQSVFTIMKNTYNVDVAFWPMFLNEIANGPAFADISYGMANWGDRTAANNNPISTTPTSKLGRIKAVQDRGDKWMQPVSLQDARPAQQIFYEAHNTTNLRNTWKIAIDGGADMVHIPTWNDFAEGSQIEPSAKLGWTALDLNAYYLTWYKTGKAPAIVRDTVYLSHRTMPSTARGTAETLPMKPLTGTTLYDQVEATTFLTAPGTVTVNVGSNQYTFQAEAGVQSFYAPLGAGVVSAKVTRNGAMTAGTTSSHPVVLNPKIQDMDYVSASSGRSPMSGPTQTTPPTTPPTTTPPTTPPTTTPPTTPPTTTPPTTTPPTTTTPTVSAQSFTVESSADTYVQGLAATTNSGSIASVVSNGTYAANAYLRFALPAAPAGTRLTSAALQVWVATNATAGSAQAHSVTLASNSWDEMAVTWNTKPYLVGSGLGTITGATALDTQKKTTLNAAGLASFAGSQVTLAVTSTGTDELRFWSKEFAVPARRPQLLLTYTPGSAAPAATPTPSPAPIIPAIQTVDVEATADTYVQGLAADTNSGSVASVVSNGTYAANAYLRFAVPAAPAGKKLTGAALKVWVATNTTAGSAQAHSVTLASNSWDEMTMTWKTKPALVGSALGTITGATALDTQKKTTLNAAGLASFAGSQVTLAVTSTGTDELRFWSSEFAVPARRPQLELTYS